jgi:chromosome partitioning protein
MQVASGTLQLARRTPILARVNIVAVANHKGGVGKTATAHALATVLSEQARVLMVDADPHASLTGACGVDVDGANLADVMTRRMDARRVTRSLSPTPTKLGASLSLLPASLALTEVELSLVAKIGRETAMLKALAPLADEYDYCVIDCAPSLGLLTVNALAASRGVIIPTQPSAQDLRALASFIATVGEIAQEINPGLEIIGILPTFYDPRYTHHNDAIEAMKAARWPMLDMAITRSVRMQEAAAQGESIITYAPDHHNTQAYKQLAEVVTTWAERSKKRR